MITVLPTSNRLTAGAAAVVLTAVFSATAGWIANGWRLEAGHRAEIGERDARLAAAKDLARLREQDWTTQRHQALDNANSRDQIIRTLAAGSASTSRGLHDTLAAIGRGVPDASAEALRHSTTALASVLRDCQARYRELAEKADRHASDTLTFEQAWPTDQAR